LSPQQLFKRVARSVFVVEALDRSDSVIAFGSGVAIAHNLVVSNKHVVQDAISLRVRQGDLSWKAEIDQIDKTNDLCLLLVPGLGAATVTLRQSTTLAVGERVYAIGAPEGLELTFSEGLISGLRRERTIVI
jgi:S1-C subfamily serine protease